MDGLMMDYDLTLPAMMQRAESLYGGKETGTRNPDKKLSPLHLRGLYPAGDEPLRRAGEPRQAARTIRGLRVRKQHDR
jgi:hypothetical protein